MVVGRWQRRSASAMFRRLKSMEPRERSSVECDAVIQKIGEHYVSACLISGRCPEQAVAAALRHLNEMWKAHKHIRNSGQAAVMVQKAFKIQSLYMIESAKELELFVKHKKIFETVLKGSDAVKRNIELAEKDLENRNILWQKAIKDGDRKKATEIVNESLNVYKKFRNNGIKVQMMMLIKKDWYDHEKHEDSKLLMVRISVVHI
eukprot:jgi/Bigna1/144739/aug1.91_g19447